MYGPNQHTGAALAATIFALFCGAASLGQAPSRPSHPEAGVSTETAELQAAAEEFKIATRALGYRAQSEESLGHGRQTLLLPRTDLREFSQ